MKTRSSTSGVAALSVGILLYRKTERGTEVLLVHPSGNYNANAPWSVPKGMPEPNEKIEDAGRRELLEETGVEAPHVLTFIGKVQYKTGKKKTVVCFVGKAPTECKPRCASWEVDKAEFVDVVEARRILNPAQRDFLERLDACGG